MGSLYLKEKALGEEYPGIGFRDSVGGREAYVLGHRVADWEGLDVYAEAKTIVKKGGAFSVAGVVGPVCARLWQDLGTRG